MRGGHGRGGPTVFDASTRALRGTRERLRHRTKGVAGAVVGACEPPAGLDGPELAAWSYYAPLLAASGRLTAEARDALGSYCTTVAAIGQLKRAASASRKRIAGPERSAIRRELRQWIQVGRLLESDLLLSPAAAVRAPSVLPPAEAEDAFAEFDPPSGDVQ